MRVVCVYLNFEMDEHGWAPAPGASPFPTPLGLETHFGWIWRGYTI